MVVSFQWVMGMDYGVGMCVTDALYFPTNYRNRARHRTRVLYHILSRFSDAKEGLTRN